MRSIKKICLLAALVSTAFGAHAQNKKWWPIDVFDGSSPGKVVKYSPLEKAQKPWRICVLFPHMKDSYFTAVNYGIVEEARRLGVSVSVFEAGGYDQLPRQISQFDDCRASNFDAIIVGAISEAGLKQKLEEAAAAKKPVIATANPIMNAPIAGRAYNSFQNAGANTGKALLEKLKGAPAKAVTFPGPQGSGFAEALRDGFVGTLKGSKVEILDQKFGDTGVSVQMRLVQDALQTHPKMNVIWGTAPTAEAAVTAVSEAGRDDIVILASYENQAMLDAVKRNEIFGFATGYPVLTGRIALDMAVRNLEQKNTHTFVHPIPGFVSKDTVGKTDLSLVFAPASFKPVYKVEAGK
ncbi:MAG: periplasmic protein TorT [Burkholderiales bacterium]|jgi:protein TorT